MPPFEVVLELRGASLRIPFESAGELEQKIDALDLLRVANAIDAARERLPHPPMRDALMQAGSAPW